MKPSTGLKKARKLIERGWCKGPMATDKDGLPIEPMDAAACHWCAAGALLRANNGSFDDDACDFLDRANPRTKYVTYKDTKGVSQKTVIRAFDRAIKLAISEGQ